MNWNISSILDESIKEIETNDYLDTQNVVLLPPSNDPFTSDEEEGADDIGLSGNINLPINVSGIAEVYVDIDGSDDIDMSNDNGLDEPYPNADQRRWKDGTKIFLISIPLGTKMAKLRMLLKGFLQLLDLSESELCKLHFDDEVDQLCISFTKKNVNTQKNDPTFNINKNYPWDFFTNVLHVSVKRYWFIFPIRKRAKHHEANIEESNHNSYSRAEIEI